MMKLGSNSAQTTLQANSTNANNTLRTQSNPNNRVTAFIKIQHMPAEILLKQQKPQPTNHNHL